MPLSMFTQINSHGEREFYNWKNSEIFIIFFFYEKLNLYDIPKLNKQESDLLEGPFNNTNDSLYQQVQ